MMDVARQHLDVEIQRTESTRTMLKHLADAIEHGPSQSRGETYQADAIEALLHGSELARDRVQNLKHCGRIYDAKVEAPVEEPSK